MGSPAIFKGSNTALLTAGGLRLEGSQALTHLTTLAITAADIQLNGNIGGSGVSTDAAFTTALDTELSSRLAIKTFVNAKTPLLLAGGGLSATGDFENNNFTLRLDPATLSTSPGILQAADRLILYKPGTDTSYQVTPGFLQSGIDHNLLLNYEANQHIDWTAASDALVTTGTVTSESHQATGTGANQLPSGTTAQRPGSPVNGNIRYNSETSEFEGYAGGAWGPIGGGGGSSKQSIIKTNANDGDTLAAGDEVGADTSTASFTLNLPAITADGETIRVLDLTNSFSSTQTVTLVPSGGNTIDGQTNLVLDVVRGHVELVSFGTNWLVLALFATSGGGSGTSLSIPVLSEWQSYTPNTTAGLTAISSSALEWRQVGDTVEVRGHITGTAAGATPYIELPNTYTISGPDSSTFQIGTYSRDVASVITTGVILGTNGNTYIEVAQVDVRDGVNQNALSPANLDLAISSGLRISVQFAVKVQELNVNSTVNISAQGNPSESAAGTGINLINNPDGAQSLDQSQTNGVGDWVDSSTGTSSSVTTTSSEIPLSPDIETAIKIDFTNSLNDYTRYRFTMPESLKNTKLGISWYQLVDGANYTNGDARVELYYNAASDYTGGYTEVVLAADDSSGDSLINAVNGRYVNAFDEGGNDYYELRIINNAATGSNEWIALNAVTVGPGVNHNAPALSGWQSYTPATTTGVTAFSDVQLEWRQVGEDIEIRGHYTGTHAAQTPFISLPNGYTISNVDASTRICGEWAQNSASVAATGVILATDGDPYFEMVEIDVRDSSNQNPLVARNVGSVVASSTRVSIKAKVKVAELEGKGTVNTLVEDNLSNWEFVPSTWTNVTWSSSTTYTRRDGPDLLVDFRGVYSSGSVTDWQLDIPNGHGFASSITTDTNTGSELGQASGYLPASAHYQFNAYAYSAGKIAFKTNGANGSVKSNTPATWVAGDVLRFQIRVPVDTWENSTQNSLVGSSDATSTQSGLVKKNRWQKKVLSGSVINSGTLTDLTFNNLVVGKQYRVVLQMAWDVNVTTSSVADHRIEIYDGGASSGSLLAAARYYTDHDSSNPSRQLGVFSTEAIFTATTTFVEFEAILSGGSVAIIDANGTYGKTWSMIEELNNYDAETSDFT